MPHYRAYLVSSGRHVEAVRDLDCSTDIEAVAGGREMLRACIAEHAAPVAVEIWDGIRYVATLSAPDCIRPRP